MKLLNSAVVFKKIAKASACVALVVSSASFAQDPLKVGFVYVSPVGDAGWTSQHDAGRAELEEAFGDKISIKAIEAVKEGAESERVIRELAASGHDLIFATSFGYMNPTQKVAKMFPEVVFEHATGFKQAKNMGNYVARFYEARYLTGMAAAATSESGILGYVAAFPIPEVVRGINAYTLGAQRINPDIKVKVVWVNSWFDPGREREAGEALIAQGADVLTHHTDSTAVVATAQDNGVNAIAYHSDMSKYGADAQLTAATHHWGEFYKKRVQQVLDNNWTSESVWGGMAEGMVDIAPLSAKVPADSAALVVQAKAEIISGALHPFAGPIMRQDGSEAVAEGEVMPDDQLKQMAYYVKGVEGDLPK